MPVITARRLQRAGEGLVEDGFLEFVEGGKFLFVDGFQALGFDSKQIQFGNYSLLRD